MSLNSIPDCATRSRRALELHPEPLPVKLQFLHYSIESSVQTTVPFEVQSLPFHLSAPFFASFRPPRHLCPRLREIGDSLNYEPYVNHAT